MPETTRLEGFDSKKVLAEAETAQRERDQWEQDVYGTAGVEDFSDAARKRVEEGDEYERHMKSLMDRGEESAIDALDRNMEHDIERGHELYQRDKRDKYDAENKALQEKFDGDVNLRRMEMISSDIENLREEVAQLRDAEIDPETMDSQEALLTKKEEILRDKEDNLNRLLVKYSQRSDYDEAIADFFMNPKDGDAVNRAASHALKEAQEEASKPNAVIDDYNNLTVSDDQPKPAVEDSVEDPQPTREDLGTPNDTTIEEANSPNEAEAVEKTEAEKRIEQHFNEQIESMREQVSRLTEQVIQLTEQMRASGFIQMETEAPIATPTNITQNIPAQPFGPVPGQFAPPTYESQSEKSGRFKRVLAAFTGLFNREKKSKMHEQALPPRTRRGRKLARVVAFSTAMHEVYTNTGQRIPDMHEYDGIDFKAWLKTTLGNTNAEDLKSVIKQAGGLGGAEVLSDVDGDVTGLKLAGMRAGDATAIWTLGPILNRAPVQQQRSTSRFEQRV